MKKDWNTLRLLCLCLIFSGCASLGFPTLDQEMQTSDQRVMTESQASEIVSQVLKDKKITYQNTVQDARVTGILQRLGQAAGSGVPFTARLYQDTQANAFSIGGKYVFVSSGILELFKKDDDLLAGVLGHEISHDIAGHHERQQTEALWRDTAAKLAAKLGQNHASVVNPLTQTTSTLLGLNFSRSQEKEADIMGVYFAYHAGYDPLGLIRFFEKTNNAMNSNKFVSLLSTHPYHPARVTTIQLVSRYLKNEITLAQVQQTDKQVASVLQSLERTKIRVAPSTLR